MDYDHHCPFREQHIHTFNNIKKKNITKSECLMIKPYLKPNLQQKLRIPVSCVDDHKSGRFATDINRIMGNLERDGGANLQVMKSTRIDEEEIIQPKPTFRQPPPKVSYIVPIQRIRCFEIQEKVKLEHQINDLYLEKKYRERGLRKGTPKILRSGFAFNSKRENVTTENVKESLKESYESEQKFKFNHSEVMNSRDDAIQPSTDIQTQNASYEMIRNEYMVERSNQTDTPSIPGNSTYYKIVDFPVSDTKVPIDLPKLPSYLNKKGTRFGREERKIFEVASFSPGPCEYTTKRFGDQNLQYIYYQRDPLELSPQLQEQLNLNLMKKRSMSLLPPVNQEKEAIKKLDPLPKQRDINLDRMVDRFGIPLYPISQRFQVFPGPADYDNEVNSLSKRMMHIKEEQSIRTEIKDWLKKQASQQPTET